MLFALLGSLFGILIGGAAGVAIGRGIPSLVQRSGSLARRSRTTELVFGTVLLLPWLIGIGSTLLVLTHWNLLFPVLGYWGGMMLGRRFVNL